MVLRGNEEVKERAGIPVRARMRSGCLYPFGPWGPVRQKRPPAVAAHIMRTTRGAPHIAGTAPWGPAHHEDDPWGPVRWTTRTSHG